MLLGLPGRWTVLDGWEEGSPFRCPSVLDTSTRLPVSMGLCICAEDVLQCYQLRFAHHNVLG